MQALARLLAKPDCLRFEVKVVGIEAWMHTDGRKKGMRKFTLNVFVQKKRNAKGMEGEGMMNDC